ncbi:MAG: arylsulfatase [Parasphingopyxis sp.]|uniref:arylsulfatase n=1 Tax=Parasphingopyxis sp. TaxID=1920299 RepID=UPI003FA10383
MAIIAMLFAAPAHAQPAERPAQRPNIVLIVADDVAFTDLGAYGSEIRTPNIDALARRGTIFSNFHATPMCAPSRAMLMTGVSSHRAGIGNLPETTPEEHRGAPAYRGLLAEGLPTIATRLRARGYRTYMTGKWHLGHTRETLPSARGFDRTFILDSTGADNWEHRPYLPYYDRAEWFADGEPVDTLPDDFYSSEFLVDRMIDFVGTAEGDDPFFAYIGFLAIHIPVQAPREYTMRYADMYRDGWRAHRERRHAAAIEAGLIPVNAPLGTIHPDLRDWDDLSAEEQAWYARAMAVNAGMLEAMDDHLGRLIAHLREIGEYENTIFIVTSDNGPEGNSPGGNAIMQAWMWMVGYSTDIDTMGERGSFGYIGPEWASANASPHSLFKFYANEGGTRVPLIVAGPGVAEGAMADQLSLISDIPATIAALADADGGGMTGRSLMPALTGEESAIYGPDDSFGIETAGRMAFYRGRYKIVRNGPPLGDNVWRLYDLEADPGETRDLSASEPELFAEMQAGYARWAEENGVLDMPEGYDPIQTLMEHSRGPLLHRYWWVLLLLGGIILAPIGLLIWRRRSRRTA